MGLGTGQTLEKERKNDNKQFIYVVDVSKILTLQVKKEKDLAPVDNIQSRKTEGKVSKEGRSNKNRGLGNK